MYLKVYLFKFKYTRLSTPPLMMRDIWENWQTYKSVHGLETMSTLRVVLTGMGYTSVFQRLIAPHPGDFATKWQVKPELC